MTYSYPVYEDLVNTQPHEYYCLNGMDTHVGNGLFYFNELFICSFIACTFLKP